MKVDNTGNLVDADFFTRNLIELRNVNSQLIDVYLKSGELHKADNSMYLIMSINNEIDLFTLNREN